MSGARCRSVSKANVLHSRAGLHDAVPNVIAVDSRAPILFDTEQGPQLTELMQKANRTRRDGTPIEIPKRLAAEKNDRPFDKSWPRAIGCYRRFGSV